jgi:uncharacterized protein YukE
VPDDSKIRVDPDALHGLSSGIFAHADAAHAEWRQHTAQASQASAGWVGSSADALDALTASWTQRGTALHEHTVGMGATCRQSAYDFAEQEDKNTEQIRGVAP